MGVTCLKCVNRDRREGYMGPWSSLFGGKAQKKRMRKREISGWGKEQRNSRGKGNRFTREVQKRVEDQRVGHQGKECEGRG